MATFEFDLEQNLLALHEELRDKTYRPGPYRNFTIREPKVRRISAAPFRDRVVHHALMQVTWPIFEARMIHDSYACRVGKGTHKAIDRAQEFSRRYRYVLQCDVVQFFPAIDHATLRSQLAHHIACPDTLWLMDRILASGQDVLAGHYDMVYFPGDDLLAAVRPRGCRSATSPRRTGQTSISMTWTSSLSTACTATPICATPTTSCSSPTTSPPSGPGAARSSTSWPSCA